MTENYKMFINGEWCLSSSGKNITVTNPATCEILGTVPAAEKEEVDIAVASADSVKNQYRLSDVGTRFKLLYNIAEEIKNRASEIANMLCLEQGKPYYTEALTEVNSIINTFIQSAEDLLRMNAEVLPSRYDKHMAIVKREADGLYAVITPWNYPLDMPAQYIAPGLASGNVIVYKPASNTPISSVFFVEAIEKAIIKTGLSTKILQFVTGSGSTVGDYLVSHPLVDGIGFTGETSTGKQILARAGLKKVILEMGGNGPSIILDDCNIAEAAKNTAIGFLENSGQICSGTERILIQKSIKDEFLKEFITHFKNIKMGNPLNKETTMGPLNNENSVKKIELHIQDALNKGAKLIFGGKRAPEFGSDLFFEPTILDNVTKDMLIYYDETFGPVAPIILFDTDEEAINIANGGIYGLQMAVYTSSIKRSSYFSERLHSGVVAINTSSTYYESHFPFGGAVGTQTGWGRVGGKYGLEQMTHTKTIIINPEL